MTKTNKKGRKLMDDVNAEWQRQRLPMGMEDFKKGAQDFIGQIKGQSTGQPTTCDFQQRKQSGWLKKRGIFEGDTTATPEQVMLKKKKDAKRAVGEAKRLAKRQRGSVTLKKRKMEVPEYLQKLEELKKYKKGFQLIWLHFAKKHYEDWARNPAAYSNGSSEEIYEKLQSLGLIK